MSLLPKRNYAEMLIILLLVALYSLCPSEFTHALGLAQSMYLQAMGTLLIVVMLVDILVMTYWQP